MRPLKTCSLSSRDISMTTIAQTLITKIRMINFIRSQIAIMKVIAVVMKIFQRSLISRNLHISPEKEVFITITKEAVETIILRSITITNALRDLTSLGATTNSTILKR